MTSHKDSISVISAAAVFIQVLDEKAANIGELGATQRSTFGLKVGRMLTSQQLYELYRSGPERMLHFVEQLLSHLAEVESHVGHRQQYTIDRLKKDVARLANRADRLKKQLLKHEMLNYQLTEPHPGVTARAGTASRAGQ